MVDADDRRPIPGGGLLADGEIRRLIRALHCEFGEEDAIALIAWAGRARVAAAMPELILDGTLIVTGLKDGEPLCREKKKDAHGNERT